MITYKNITIIGTSHIALESIQEVTTVLQENKPGIVALELDHARFLSLMEKKKVSKWVILKETGIKSFLLNLIGAFIEKKLGDIVGVSPGSEMRKAALLARKQKAKIALIDQDVRITLKKLTKIPSKEKWRIFGDIVKGLFQRKAEMRIDLTKVPEQKFIETILKKIEDRYPNLYATLITERNHYMAKSLYKLITEYPEEKIVAIVGAGHAEALLKEIKEYETT